MLGAEIEPKIESSLLRNHFCNRYANESFFIYDSTHKDLLLYSSGRSRMMRVDSLQLALPGEEGFASEPYGSGFMRRWPSGNGRIPLPEYLPAQAISRDDDGVSSAGL